uniref:Uncharacterized protein n=1 Tax=Tetranychus urticae TaxID=32264 RepID=T1K2C2_TETUR
MKPEESTFIVEQSWVKIHFHSWSSFAHLFITVDNALFLVEQSLIIFTLL